MIDYSQYEDSDNLNYWELDPVFRSEIKRVYSEDEWEYGEESFDEFGELLKETIAENAMRIDSKGPELKTHDREGEIVNEVEYQREQLENDRLTFEHGAVADSFVAPDTRDEPMPLTHSLGMYYLIGYVDTGLGCSTSMTGGVALVLERHDDGQLQEFFDDLVSKDIDDHIQGAMFLTEKQGGSDVGKNETVAKPTDEEGVYELEGEKWFCSNIDAGAPLVLARTPDAPEGTKGLSLFLVPQEKRNGEPNDFYYRRLKDKLGTISVPTGEVELRDAEAYLVGELERGFKYMATMLNYERVTNAVGSAGIMGRSLLESKIHAANREAFGKTLDEHPLMKRDLVEMAVDHEAATALAVESANYLDEYMRGEDDEAYKMMRAIVPVTKYRTARMAINTASYAMEVRGGDGYVEEYVTNQLLRDAQVLPIWEGTSNIMSLEVLKAMQKEAAYIPLLNQIDSYLDDAEHPYLENLAEEIRDERDGLEESFNEVAVEGQDYAQLYAKDIADYIFEVYASALLVSEAQREIDEKRDARKAVVAHEFIDRHLRDKEKRGITSGDRFALEKFDAVVRFDSVDPNSLIEENTVEANN